MTSQQCDDEICITCSDQLLSVQIVSLSDDGMSATGVCDGEPCQVSIELVDGVGVGDVVLAHGGVALQTAGDGSIAVASWPDDHG